MAFVSESMRASLENLNAKIHSAEKVLRKVPGSRSENAVIFLGWYDDGEDAFMRFGCPELRDRIVVNELGKFKTLDEYSIDLQTSLASSIPDLLTLSVDSESDVRASIDDVASAIEHSLAGLETSHSSNCLPTRHVKENAPHSSAASCQSYIAFWEQLLAKANHITPLHSNTAPSHENSVYSSAGQLWMKYAINRGTGRVELSISRKSKKANKAIFDELHDNRTSIESDFGAALNWLRQDDKLSSRIEYTLQSENSYEDRGAWGELQDEMINLMVRLEGALALHVGKYRDGADPFLL